MNPKQSANKYIADKIGYEICNHSMVHYVLPNESRVVCANYLTDNTFDFDIFTSAEDRETARHKLKIAVYPSTYEDHDDQEWTEPYWYATQTDIHECFEEKGRPLKRNIFRHKEEAWAIALAGGWKE